MRNRIQLPKLLKAFKCGSATLVIFCSAAWVEAAEAKFVKFDVPGAAATAPYSINSKGEIAGVWYDHDGGRHGFFRDASGNITKFDPHGGDNTTPLSINNKGIIAGYFNGSAGYEAFEREADGSIVAFTVPGFTEANAYSINEDGDITGSANTGTDEVEFVRYADGTLSTFQAPGAFATEGTSINDNGEVTGYYVGSLEPVTYVGFTVTAKGAFTEIPFNAGNVVPVAINPAGTVAAFFFGGENGTQGSFAYANGVTTTFACAEPITQANGMNAHGEIVGTCHDLGSTYPYVGFVRGKNGAMKEFEVKGSGTGSNQGTWPECINASGVMAGAYVDMLGFDHGFAGTP